MSKDQPMIKIFIFFILFILLSTNIGSSNQTPSTSYQRKTIHTTLLSSTLPTSFDWRNVDGVDYSTPIKNQAPAPTCEAYGLCVALETMIHYMVGYSFGCDLSEAHLFFYAGGSIDHGGVRLSYAADYLINHGVPDEGCFPDPHRPYDGPFESIPGWENRTVKITSWGWVDKTEEAMKQALITYGPLVVCIYNRDDLFRYRQGIYMPNGIIKGGHVVALIGYNDDQRYWVIQNSAGTDWGEDGYLRVSYDADTSDHPFFADFYGGTGIMYIDGIYGNFQSDVPKITIEQPAFYHTYLFGRDISTLVTKGILFQKGAPRILGKLPVTVIAENTEKIEFYVDGTLVSTDEEAPFSFDFSASRGLHILEAIAYHQDTVSKDIVDIQVLL